MIELGTGDGANFEHYPATVTEVLAVEPENHMRTLAEKNASKAPVPIRVVAGLANALPAEDGSFNAGIVWFIRIQRAGRKVSMRRTARRGGALLAAGGLLALAGCGHSSRATRADARTSRAAPAWSPFARSEQRMLGRPVDL